MIKSVSDLDIFKLSYTFAMEIFKVSRNFPREEVYSLTDQVIRSSRSISANIAEGFGKRIYEQEFKKHLIYSVGSLEETKVWISFAKDCGYITVEVYDHLFKVADDIGAKLYKLHQSWTTFK